MILQLRQRKVLQEKGWVYKHSMSLLLSIAYQKENLNFYMYF